MIDFTGSTWKKASYSGQSSGNCVEVAGASDRFGVRDTKDRNSGTLVFDSASWSSFVDGVKAGRFDG